MAGRSTWKELGGSPVIALGAAPARASEGQRPDRGPPLSQNSHPFPGKAPARQPRCCFVPRPASLFSAFWGGQRWSPYRLGHLIQFHRSREIASCYSRGVSQGKGEQNHLPRSIPLASRADPLLDFLLNGGSSRGVACYWRLRGTGHSDVVRFLPLRGFLETQV